MEGALLAEEGGGGVGKEEGEESGTDGRSGKRALESVVVEKDSAGAVGTSDAEGEESETGSGEV